MPKWRAWPELGNPFPCEAPIRTQPGTACSACSPRSRVAPLHPWDHDDGRGLRNLRPRGVKRQVAMIVTARGWHPAARRSPSACTTRTSGGSGGRRTRLESTLVDRALRPNNIGSSPRRQPKTDDNHQERPNACNPEQVAGWPTRRDVDHSGKATSSTPTRAAAEPRSRRIGSRHIGPAPVPRRCRVPPASQRPH